MGPVFFVVFLCENFYHNKKYDKIMIRKEKHILNEKINMKSEREEYVCII